jgi:peroxiredoxin
MRKKYGLAVLCLVSLFGILGAGVPCSDQKSRVCFSLAEALGNPDRPVLLLFFSLDCHVCWEDLIEMKYFIEKNSIPIGIIGISKDGPDELREFLDKYSFPYPVVCDRRNDLFRRFKVNLEPFLLIIRKDDILYEDNACEDFITRRERVTRWLFEMASR